MSPRCRFCRCILRAEETKARGYCRFRACIEDAHHAAAEAKPPAVAYELARGESPRKERWETGRVRMTRARWLLEPEDYKLRNPARVLRLDPTGATVLYPVDFVDDDGRRSG